jgi:3-oxoacyl-[acyl-carrier-protein] synthase-3
LNRSRVIGAGAYLPERVMTNAELERLVDTSDEWIRTRTGIRQRHIAADGETTSDMACAAALRALAAAGKPATAVDLIVVATSTPDLIYPSTACLLQKRLGIRNGGAAFDVQAVCSGFVYALAIADRFVSTNAASLALVIGADINSRILDWTDRGTCVLFGDGAGAVLLAASAEPGIFATRLHADGHYADMLRTGSGVSDRRGEPFVRMKGAEVFKFAVRVMEEMVDEILADTGMSKDAVDWLIPHQANERIITATAKKLGIPMERVILTVDRHGNTSAASIPLALAQGIGDGRVKPGQLLLLEAVGGGFTWGSALLRL